MSSSNTARCDSTQSQAQLLSRLQGGESKAVEEVVRSLSGRALSTSRRLLHNEDDAQEAVQDALLSFYKSIATFNGQCLLSTWLHRITVNAAIMKRRSYARRPKRSIEDWLPTFCKDGHRIDPRSGWTPMTDAQWHQGETRQMVWKLIDEQPEDYRVVLILRDFDQIDNVENTEILGQTVGTIKTKLHRARQAMRTLLEKELGP